MKPTKEQIIALLYAWIGQRPGLEYGNYGDPKSYRAELRGITKDGTQAKMLLRKVELSSMTAEDLLEGFRAYSGRLTIGAHPKKPGEFRLDYCTGQYWPTEYRRAVCAVLASALWGYYREDFAKAAKPGESPGDAIRRCFRREYGKGIQARWFD